jgi:CHAT domain-containing protein
MRAWRVFLVVALALSACGGAPVNSSVNVNAVSDARVAQWKKAWAAGTNDDLVIARDLVARPVNDSAGERAGARMILVRSLAKYVLNHDATPELDQEVEQAFSEASELKPRETLLGAGVSAIGVYYANTDRPGRSIPYYRRALGIYQRSGDRFKQWAMLVSLSTARASQGEFVLRDADWRDAAKLSKDFPPKPVPLAFWRTWFSALDGYCGRIVDPLNNADAKPNVAALDRLWPLLERAGQHIEPKARAYSEGAMFYAMAGRVDRARELLAKAEALAPHVATPATETQGSADDVEATPVRADANEDSTALARSLIALHSNDYKTCATLTAAAVDARVAKGMKLRHRDYRFAGECAEGNGDLDTAEAYYTKGIDLSEGLRGSFTVAERAAIFRGPLRTVYWGLMRTLAKHSLATKGAASDAYFLSALRAMELLRARQLGELLETRGAQTGKLESLTQVTSTLGPDDALVSYIVMEHEVLVLALSRERHVAALIPVPLGDLVEQATAIAKALAKGDSDLGDLQTRLGVLGKTLLGPVASVVSGKKRLLVLPDGVLNVVPFDLLSAGAPYRPLVDDTTVQLLPSLQLFLSPTPAQPPATALLAVGDPTYAAPHAATGDADGADDGTTRGNKYLGYFTALPETRDEVKRIAALFEVGKVKTLLGADASESNVKKVDFGQYGFLHFATHGVLGRDVPGIAEPAIVLANEQGEDGFLTASDAMKLHLNAQLTVLSACKTGAGDYQSGEGVMGMSRAFLVAGSRSALVSLWSVDSAATEALMVDFYKQFKAGIAPAEALRRAKLTVRNGGGGAVAPARGLVLDADKRAAVPIAATAEWKHPFYWGAFVLVGR